MKFVSGALATALSLAFLARGESDGSRHAPPVEGAVGRLPADPAMSSIPPGFEYDAFAPMPPAPGSGTALPAAFQLYLRAQEQYEEGLRLTSPLALRHPGHSSAGPYKVLVLLIRFSDNDVADLPTREEIRALFNNHVGVDPTQPFEKLKDNDVNPTGSVSEVFAVNSNGTLVLDAEVTDWIPLAHNGSYYASDAHGVGHSGKGGSRFEDGIREALDELAKTDFDWSPYGYDAAKGGQMDGFGVIHSGHGAEYGGPGNEFRVWSIKGNGVQWPVPGNLARTVNKYYTTSAFHGKPPSTHMMRIGTSCHEIGHSLGLPDLYDTSFAGEGLGNYDLMAYGNFGFDNSGHFPSSLSAYSKLYLDWVAATPIEEDGTYSLEAGSHKVYKISHGFPTGDKPEYLLLENRQPVGYDSAMVEGGIAIYHVDESVQRQKSPGFPGMDLVKNTGYPANKKHYRVALVASDGTFGLEQGATKGVGGDLLWHANSTLHEFGPGLLVDGEETVFPSTVSYQKGRLDETGVRIFNFSASGMSMTFQVEGIGGPNRAAYLRAPTVAHEIA